MEKDITKALVLRADDGEGHLLYSKLLHQERDSPTVEDGGRKAGQERRLDRDEQAYDWPWRFRRWNGSNPNGPPQPAFV